MAAGFWEPLLTAVLFCCCLLLAAFVQVGWMTGPAHLLAPIIKAHQFVVFTVATNLQHAVAYGLDNEQQFYL